MSALKKDYSGVPITIIPIDVGAFKFYPLDIEAITAFLECEREKKEDEEPFCGAV